MTRPKGRSTDSRSGESELAGRHEPPKPRPANPSDALAERLAARAAGDGADGAADDSGIATGAADPAGGAAEPATDALLDAKEARKSRRRKAPGPTREGGAADATGADGIPDLVCSPAEATEPGEPTERPGG
ncbi:hypothetical protein GCM10022415_13460 [Knoellia locipacati]|uniref:Uncharacterized protein n=1 Tax=Knoellia locipacati TaxID=882824 RepID=A0A512SZC4_9MICO|nr:hypothetical protein [Knoellia locipacati]GEQ13296.1 hypothetical protein KLO01_13430 [Knoellia locipacati]